MQNRQLNYKIPKKISLEFCTNMSFECHHRYNNPVAPIPGIVTFSGFVL